MEDLSYASAREISDAVRRKEASATEVMEALASRLDEVNPVINAICTTDFERALATAKSIDDASTPPAGQPLLGVPISIKDLTDTAGLRTTFGSRHYADRVPTHDAEVVRRIKAAGAIVYGKSNTPEFGAGINTVNELFGATRNPWDPSRSAGGSSGGAAAAVAAGLGPIAEATDHGCSVRLPASLNGLVGLRPTPGRVPQWPNQWAYDPFVVTGPLARTVDDCELLFSVMSGPDRRVPISDHPPYAPADPRDSDLTGWRVGWSADLGIAAVDPEVRAICEDALSVFADAGAHVEGHAPDFTDVRQVIDPIRAARQVAQGAYLADLGEVSNRFVSGYLELAQKYSAHDVGLAEAARSALWQRVSDFFTQHELLVTVTTQFPAYPVDELFPPEVDGRAMSDAIDACITCYAITVTGLPAISIPVGVTAAGLPVGLQVVGPRLRESELFTVARVFEARRPWGARRPHVASTGASHVR